jgi:hypothetical protein
VKKRAGPDATLRCGPVSLLGSLGENRTKKWPLFAELMLGRLGSQKRLQPDIYIYDISAMKASNLSSFYNSLSRSAWPNNAEATNARPSQSGLD